MTATDFANGRVKAMRSRLLGAPDMRELLGQRDLVTRVEWLRRTTYGEAIAAELAAGAPAMIAVERALRARIAEDIERIRRSLFESALPLFDAMMGSIDAYDLETILRTAGSGSHVEHVLSLLVRTPLLDERTLAELAGRGDVRGLYRVLGARGNPFAAPFAEVLAGDADEMGGGSLLALEAAIDRFAFARALDAAHADGESGRVCVEIVELQIDLTNAALLLKGVREPGLFLEGGRWLDRKEARRLLALDERELTAALTRAPPLRGISPAVLTRPSLLDQVLLQALSTAVSRLARMHPLSLAVPLAFIVDRVMEARCVRLVLRGAEAGAPTEELLGLVEVRPR